MPVSLTKSISRKARIRPPSSPLATRVAIVDGSPPLFPRHCVPQAGPTLLVGMNIGSATRLYRQDCGLFGTPAAGPEPVPARPH